MESTATADPPTETADNGGNPSLNLPGVQDRRTFGDALMERIEKVTDEETDKDVVWRWAFPDKNYLSLFVALAEKYGLHVFVLKGTRGQTVYVRGPRNLIWDLKKFAWDNLRDVARAAIEAYFLDVVGPEAGLDLDLDVMDRLPVEEGEVKPSRTETEKW